MQLVAYQKPVATHTYTLLQITPALTAKEKREEEINNARELSYQECEEADRLSKEADRVSKQKEAVLIEAMRIEDEFYEHIKVEEGGQGKPEPAVRDSLVGGSESASETDSLRYELARNWLTRQHESDFGGHGPTMCQINTPLRKTT
eukprot:gene32003-33930_t